MVGRTRRQLAADLGFADDSGYIPAARWTRAMTFEHLVRDVRFAGEVATTTVGRVALERPTRVVTVNARVHVDETADLLAAAHVRAVEEGAATLVHGLAVPFAGFEHSAATEVKPDFAVVAARPGQASWLIVGDAKDYERVRSRIDDTRLLKGFLQVALGAESAAEWSRLPKGMAVHSHGVLAVPRNSFLQPEALVEALHDHRAEVRMRVAQRRREAAGTGYVAGADVARFVAHLRATFDPATCTTCPLFSYCRHELRTSPDPADLLVEVGVPAELRAQVAGLVTGGEAAPRAPASVVAQVRATVDGVARRTGQLRVDGAGRPGTVDVVLAKADAAALGVHGIALRRHTGDGPGDWAVTVFDDPLSPETRRRVMRLLGHEITAAMAEATARGAYAVHVVVPDPVTADVLVSIADNLAGVELSRLRWERDREMAREPLTFDGEPARVPAALQPTERTAVSFLLEEDRARALTLRAPVLDLRAVLAQHVVAGGPAFSSLRLDYLAAWAETLTSGPLKPRELEDDVERAQHTPGARMTGRRSDAVHRALVGGRGQDPDPARYAALVTEELAYKRDVFDRALAALRTVRDSSLRDVHQAIEADAQAVWRRRLDLHASDLVRFGRTYRHWRNSLVPVIESDGRCRRQLAALGNPQAAADMAADAGVREVVRATVVTTTPLVVEVGSRRIGAGTRIVLLHVNGNPCVERPGTAMTLLKGSVKFSGLAIGPLSGAGEETVPRRFGWTPENVPDLAPGDRLVVADFGWYCDLKGNKALSVGRPAADDTSAPKPACEPYSHAEDPDEHRYCCRSHEDAEADWSDRLAERRDRGELNPQVWPPVVDEDAFEVTPVGAPVADPAAVGLDDVPDELTLDDLE
ncbi:hypothetical protein CLV71_10871 [Actinophytocola oryzae]|uniref:Uncharacterized protein n=1 Tax=Actinophytocola oryzae TaxID=502181 RepID=A0A4V3FST3_9PSEU|nr:hypothetical protein CLV71_10871 [Actinophytocola oryzae]